MNSQLDDLEVLRTLDPAADELDATSPQAQAMLRSILTSEQADVPRVRRRPRRRLRLSLAAAASVAVVAGGVVVVPALTGSDAAFATWTGTPSVVSASEKSELAQGCLNALGESVDDHGADGALGVVAERRGNWSLVVVAGDRGYEALCVTDQSSPFFKTVFGSVTTSYPQPEALGAREILMTNLGGSTVGDENLSVATGRVGADVVSISYASAELGTVHATVAGGYFAFWFPGEELMKAGKDASVQVTYRDGTTRTVSLGL